MSDAKIKFQTLVDLEGQFDAARAARDDALKAMMQAESEAGAISARIAQLDGAHEVSKRRRANAQGLMTKEQKQLEESATALDAAKTAFEKGAASKGISDKDVAPLYKALIESHAAHVKNREQFAAYEKRFEAADEMVQEIEIALGDEGTALDAARKAAAAARRAAAAKDKEAEALHDALEAAMHELGNELGAAAMPPHLSKLVELFQKEGEGSRIDFLSIRTRKINFDAWITEALAAFADEMEQTATTQAVRASALEAGVGSACGEVTKQLNRRRIKDIRREILARAYPVLLRERIAQAVPRRPEQTFPIKVEVAKDVTGLADTIVLDLDSKEPGSMRDRFAGLVAGIAVRNMKLDAPAGSASFEILKAKICAST